MVSPIGKVEIALMDEMSNVEDEELGIEVDCGMMETRIETFLP